MRKLRRRKVDGSALRRFVSMLSPGPLRTYMLYQLMSISIDGNDVSDITIDGDQVQEVTVDGDVVWTANSPLWEDKFGDGSIDSMWSQDRGTWEETSGYVHETSANDPSVLSNSQNVSHGTWLDKMTRSDDYYGNRWYFLYYGSGYLSSSGYALDYKNTNANFDVELQKYNDGTQNVLMNCGQQSSSSYIEFKVTRDSSDTFEVFRDGVSQGTTTDSGYTGTPVNFHYSDDGGDTVRHTRAAVWDKVV